MKYKKKESVFNRRAINDLLTPEAGEISALVRKNACTPDKVICSDRILINTNINKGIPEKADQFEEKVSTEK